MRFRCPNCQQKIDVLDDEKTLSEDLTCPSCNSRIDVISSNESTYINSDSIEIGRFKVAEKLGEGAFGAVFRAWDDELQRNVAIKIPRPDRLTSTTSSQFLKEARAASRLRHPGVVHVHEVGKHGDQLYIVCDYVDGISLREWRQLNSPDFGTIALMIAEICDAAESAHEAGVIHRDLKPSNILIDKENHLYVADFGLAKKDTPSDATVTREGDLIGTPAYMSPEQADGRTSEVDRRSDVYSIGVILYELLSGQRPFTGSNTRTLLHRIQTEEPSAPRKVNPGVPRDLETICLKALSKTTKGRYQTASEFADDLRQFIAGEPIKARPASMLEKLVYRCRKSPYVVICSLLAIAIIALGLRLWTQPQPEPVVIETTPSIPKTKVLLRGLRSDGAEFSKCAWAIIPLDEATRLPDLTQRQLFTDKSSLELNLESAEYLVIINIPEYGFHEVYRNLPREFPGTNQASLNHLKVGWDASSATANWPDVVVYSAEEATEGLVLVPGGKFQMGEGTKFSPRHSRTVDDLWVGQTEVTISQYLSSRLATETLQTAPADYAANGMTWHYATAYAESVGRRLFTEIEYEFLATCRGEAEVPSGNLNDYVHDVWQYGPVDSATDRLEPYGVCGLFSNVAEWTDSLQSAYPGTNNLEAYSTMMQMENYRTNRIVRGGPVTLGANDRLQNIMSAPGMKKVTVRTRSAFRTMTIDSEVGFRCVRSARARFLDDR